MKQVTKDISKLTTRDVLTIILYGLYKLSGDSNYSAISELAYALDKDNLLKLCATFGGTTIKVPTLHELNTLTDALLVVQYISEGIPYQDAIDLVGVDVNNKKNLVLLCDTLIDIINDFDA